MKRIIWLAFLTGIAAQFFQLSAQTPLKFRDTSIQGPQTFAIIMGVSKYKYVRPLTYADKDAELFRDYLQSPGGGGLKEDNIFSLLNEQALASTFWTKGFQWLRAKQLQKGDRLFIYLAGHGDAIDEDQYFFLSHDCNPAGDKNNYLVGGAIQLYNLKKKIATETSKGVEVFFVMDACRTSELPGGTQGLSFLNSAVTEKKVGEIMMLATAAGQESLEDASIGNGHGLFTWYLVDGLSGLADTEGRTDNKITFAEIKSYVDKNVPSVAQQRFNRKQDPVFCCNEYSEKVISNVDPAYLQKWLREKNSRRGGGNSFIGFAEADYKRFAADTALVETYNRFNRAIRGNNLTGNSSAEDYYRQLERKFPDNPYTLDAKSTLTDEFIQDAQKKINQYLSCVIVSSPKEKQEYTAAGARLEKAIALLEQDDPEIAADLRGRMYLLKSSGDLSNPAEALNYAHAARSLDPGKAYILNWLSRLHLQNNRADSAVYYADRAAKAAPQWPCALTTLALAQKALDKNPADPKKTTKNNVPLRKAGFGFTLGGGLNRSNPKYSGNVNTGFVGVDANMAPTGRLGIIYQVNFGNTISIRPATTVSFENTEIDFERRGVTGNPIIETVSVRGTAVNIDLPLIIRLTSKTVAPYIALGPSFSYLFSQNAESRELLPVKKSMVLAHAGIGVDIGLLKSGLCLSPELKYSTGMSDMRDDPAATPYAAALFDLKSNSFTLSLYLRKR